MLNHQKKTAGDCWIGQPAVTPTHLVGQSKINSETAVPVGGVVSNRVGWSSGTMVRTSDQPMNHVHPIYTKQCHWASYLHACAPLPAV